MCVPRCRCCSWALVLVLLLSGRRSVCVTLGSREYRGRGRTSVPVLSLGDRRSVYARSVLPVVGLPPACGTTAISVLCVSTSALGCAKPQKRVSDAAYTCGCMC